MKARKVAKKMAYRRRHESLCSHDQVRLGMLKKTMLVVVCRRNLVVNGDSDEFLEYSRILRLLGAWYLSISYIQFMREPVAPSNNVRIDHLQQGNCRINYRFSPEQLHELVDLLNIPAKVVFSNRRTMCGEEVFLRFLYEFVSGANQHRIASEVFGMDQPTQSKAFGWMVDYLYENYSKLVQNNLQWWFDNDYFRKSGKAIEYKSKIDGNLVSFFLDCNCLETHVMGGGPVGNGCDAPRWDDTIQRAFYNAWKARHGLKHQTLDNAYGMTMDMCGPESLRRNDLALLRVSNINNRLQIVQNNAPVQYIAMGDSAYKKNTHITSYHKNEERIDGSKEWNRKMKSVRISIEWNYGHTASMFKYLVTKEKLNVLDCTATAKVYTVATLLKNIHCGYYGSQTSNYFGLELPRDFVSKYIRQEIF